MNKHEVLALMLREKEHTSGEIFILVALLAEQIAARQSVLQADDFARLVSTGAALYHLGVERYGDFEAMEGLFPRSDSMPGATYGSATSHH